MHFSHDGVPATALSPIVKIYDINTSVPLVDWELASELGDGFYKYDFDEYTENGDYAILCDSVTLSGSERYVYASSGEYGESLSLINAAVNEIDVRTALIKKIHVNRLVLQDGSTNNWILYNDDNVTPLLVFSIVDKDGGAITQPTSAPSRRSKAVES